GGLVDGADDATPPCSCPPPSVQAASLACPSCGGPLQPGARACPFCSCTVATRRCPSCTAWNLASANHCNACGRSVGDPENPVHQRTNLACPRCKKTLLNRRYAELDVDECDGCGGLFIEPSMLDRIVQSKDATTGLHLALPRRPYEREMTVAYIRCPVCGKTMNRQAFGRVSGVIVDVCRMHGVWFDAGELSEVLTFVARGGLERARQKEREEMREAARSARSDAMRATMTKSMSQAGSVENQRWTGGPNTLSGVDFVRSIIDIWRGLS
ncbi:MAG: zf-TFIIB domain-containing protein, partial [Myxococcota bacterium]